MNSNACTAWAKPSTTTLCKDRPVIACRIYAPVGNHRELLAYLVRRLIENGANSSFVATVSDPNMTLDTLLRRPVDIIGSADSAEHAKISLPRDLFQPERINSRSRIRRARRGEPAGCRGRG